MISTPEISPEISLETPETLLETPETLPDEASSNTIKNKYINDNDKNECNKNMYSKKCNDIINNLEIKEREELLNINDKDFLYPNLNDKNFNIKISEKKEFIDTSYDGTLQSDFKKYADILSNADFELSNHQLFVKNFLSYNTPYNSLLLYHGLGTGKTCSSIGICEEYRDYLKQTGINKRIIIVASPNVQDNFKLQLFDERKLEFIDGLWNIKSCIGNKFLKEINPTNMKGLTKEKIITQIKTLINTYYLFLGYIEFSNFIEKVQGNNKNKNSKITETTKIKNLNQYFSKGLIVIDEVHNIRNTEENKIKIVADNVLKLITSANDVRLLLLTATPMYNSYKEIIWLLNLMNINDKRGYIQTKDIFDTDGNFKKDKEGNEIGKELLIRKSTGYISFVRGENPYIFPFRIYPNEFSVENTLDVISYPKYQINGKKIINEINYLHLYLNKIGNYQKLGYKIIVDNMKKKYKNFKELKSFNYTLLQLPIEALNIIYPIENLNELSNNLDSSSSLPSSLPSSIPSSISSSSNNSSSSFYIGGINSNERNIDEINDNKKENIIIDTYGLTGKNGLKKIMNFEESINPSVKGNFEYKQTTLNNYGKIFSKDEIGKYSCKIKTICNSIVSDTGIVSDGIILIYSQYIDSGIIPLALALEEMGITRYGDNKSLFKQKPTKDVDVYTMKPITDFKTQNPAKYIMITGDIRLSPNNDKDIKEATKLNNINGEKIKIILISKAGSEGIDLKFIRQIHIIDPWYNMNRIEQIIGRGVRNLSHKDLPFEKRNVQIFLHGTILDDNSEEETIDLYIYRIAELKSIQIGKISRILKENSVDCIINNQQTNFTEENFQKLFLKHNIQITQVLSTKQILDYKIGDKPFSSTCDYMETCNYKCIGDFSKDIVIKQDTYNESFIKNNSEKIIQKIKLLMKEKFFYKKDELIKRINIPRPYQLSHIYYSLTQMINDSSNYIIDKYGRIGYLINIGNYYLYQPSELNDKYISSFYRNVPIQYKHENIEFIMNDETNDFFKIKNTIIENKIQQIQLEKEPEKQVEKQPEKQPEKQEQEQENLLQINNIIQTIKNNYTIAINYANKSINEKIKRTQKDDLEFYKHCGFVMQILVKDKILESNILIELLMDEILDKLIYEDKLLLLNYIFNKNTKIKEKTILYQIKKYFDNKLIIRNDLLGIFLFDEENKRHLFIFKENKFIEGTQRQENILLKEITKTYQLNSIIGFMSYEPNKKYIGFKTKNITGKRNTGILCINSGKKITIQNLNEIFGFEKFTKENTKGILDIDLCIYQNFLLRYYDKINKDSKKWFFDFELSNIYNI